MKAAQVSIPSALRHKAMNLILFLGLVSLFADITYEGAHSIIGPYLGSLGATAAIVGFACGLGDFVGYALRFLFAAISDRTGHYWTFTFLGYILNLVAVPMLALAGNWQIAVTLLVLERFGKAIRTPPRDSLLAFATTKVRRGWGFGIHEAMDQIGPILGPLIISLALYLKLGYSQGFALLAIPAGLAIACLVIARINFLTPASGKSVSGLFSERAGNRRSLFWLYTFFVAFAVAGFTNFALISYHFSVTSLIPEVQIPIFFAIAMGLEGIFVLVVGRLYDRLGMRMLLLVPLLTVPIPFLAFSSSYFPAILSVVLWGAVMGIQETIMRAAIADLIQISKRGASYGIFNIVFGLALLFGNSSMGLLYGQSVLYLCLFVLAMEILSLPFILAILHQSPKHVR